MPELHIHVIDDDIDEAKAFEESWKNALSRLWGKLKFTYSNDFDDHSALIEQRPHIVIVDNVQIKDGKEYDNRGLELISDVKESHPDTVFVLFTNATFTIASLGYRQPNPDLIITKAVLPNPEYELEIATLISRHLKRYPIGKLSINGKETYDAIHLDEQELKSLAEQCVFTFLRHGSNIQDNATAAGNIPFVRSSADMITLSALTDGFSGATVLKCEIYGQNAPSDTTQFVLKIADEKSIAMEVGAYDTFVRLQMPHHLRVDLIGVGVSQNASAAFYAFAFGGSSEVISMTQLLSVGDKKIMNSLLTNLTSFGTSGWYSPVKDGTIAVENYINRSEEYAPKKEPKRVQAIRKNFEKFFTRHEYEIDDERLFFDGKSYPTPRMLLKKFRGRVLNTCICHGDLNSNNVIVLKDLNTVSVIDFEYTGMESIYKDFISLEGSLRLYFPAEINKDNLGELLTYANQREQSFATTSVVDVAHTRRDWQELAMQIANLRRHAIDHWTEQSILFDPEMYLLLSSLHTFKLMSFDIWTESQFLRLMAHYLGSISAVSK